MFHVKHMENNMKVKDCFLSHETFELRETKTPGVYKTHPVPEDLAKYYQSKNYISHHQDSGSLKERIYKFIQGFNLNYKKNILGSVVSEKAHVLDYGCGAGDFLKHIEDYVNTFGFEPHEDARNFAVQKTKKTKFVNSLKDISNASLDAITLWHVLEHMEHPEEKLQEFYQKLKPNGCLIIAVPNCSSWDAKYYGSFWAAYDVPRHLYHFTKKGMINFLYGETWNIKKIKPLLFDSFYISLLSEKNRKNPFSLFFGSMVGAISNLKASKTGEFSSLVYIIEKK